MRARSARKVAKQPRYTKVLGGYTPRQSANAIAQ
jgi:hypothetical protein